jgi:hypothetical protein
MKVMNSSGATTFAGVIMLLGCSYESKWNTERSHIALFASIEIGSARSDVEVLLGRPVLEANESVVEEPMRPVMAWYLDNPPLPPLVPPYMPGAIKIIYVQNRVVEKRLNPQIGN